MSTDAPFTPPRKKVNVLWWVGGVFILLVFLFLLQLFGPSPRIVVSPQTTYITEPLGPDGLPDYEKHILDLYRQGATPENNAAALLLQALGPAELDPSQFAAVANELGLDQIPSRAEALVYVHDDSNRERIRQWLREQDKRKRNDEQPDTVGGDEDFDLIGQQSDPYDPDAVIGQAMSRPWTSEQLPPLAQWAVRNKKPIDLLVEASHRPRYYSPSPTLLNNQRDSLIEIMFSHIQAMRDGGRALIARAMRHMGERRPSEAWQDLLALHRLARLTGQGHTLIEQLVAIALSGIACDGTQTLLHHGELAVDQARQVMQDMDGLADFSAMADSLDHTERAMFLDIVVQFSRDGGADELSDVGIGEQLSYLSVVSVNWNVVLRKGNQYYDRMVAAARLPTRAERALAFAQITGDIRRLESSIRTPATVVSAIFSPTGRGDVMAAIMISLLLPALDAAMDAQDRANATLELTRLAAAVAVYRATHGAYPDTLDELVPTVLKKLPVDLYNHNPFLYQRDGEGYLLYSAGVNGNDDGGSNERMSIFQGRPVDDSDAASIGGADVQIPAGADDISIRVPRPPFALPKSEH